MDLVLAVPLAGVATVIFVAYLAWDVLHRDAGTPRMREIADMIYEGAMAFLRRQYQTIAMLAVVTAVIIGFLIGYFGNNPDLGIRTAIAFMAGAACSGLSGFIGMYVAVKSNARTASAATRSLGEAITISLRGGAVSGFLVVALSLLGVAGIFYLYGGAQNPAQVPFLIVGFGFGASFMALFAQLGGGIYTKAADVGADLVGKIEAGIPEDDPRNAAVIADLVGDNVGDCAGRGADLFESTAAENIGAMILGVAIFVYTHNPAWIMFPLVVRAFGLFASIIGLLSVRGREGENPMRALDRGYYVTAVLSAVAMYFVTTHMLQNSWFVLSGLIGIATSIAFVYITQYYTSGSWRPVREIAEASKTGPATNIIVGTAVGYECTASTAITISLALIGAYWFGMQSGLPHGGIYGTAVATMGMLMTCAYILAMDTFGPITDNAGGINEMSRAPADARHITDALDAVGNTTKALTKGYAIGSAALAAFLLFSAYLDKVAEVTGHPFNTVNIAKVEVFVGALLGAMLVYLFSSLAIRAVGRAASSIIEEVRRQFREDPGIMAGTSRPDFGRCVDITTRAALREMVAPGLLAVGMPVVVGLLLKAEAEAALLMVGTIAGILLATVLNNGGGAWDNAKKFIEAGHLRGSDGNIVMKKSATHAAAVVGDTVGDPFKDTAGPSLHVLVKLLSTITLVLAPLFIG
ncbi:MAG: sodium-translocating pyrophosphatase [Chloroflexi bacterium]|nr:sodium-translocating pyrophosphatase [Chloroflexota bacterium]MCL5076101.1 sodium-translocating pyrophosphatase [Chloroflexota bacterium]